ncbi:WSC domain-containing protein [Cercophora newfieldiana]|uniref:WSC domain-containing protein n=1 Tax=Cercophora newfieldiana TaxID=92897 RepID=A0AA39XTE5_9PEZI|nr:WSC domain-containing protein [Cercophora newfieldiana]
MVTSLSFGLLAAPLASFLFSPAASALPSASLAPRDATRLGCFKDGSPRIFNAGFKGDNQMTIEMCATFCSSKPFFGVEYGRECFCGEAAPASSLAAPNTDCSFACAGTVLKTPAPPTVSGAPYLGCFKDASPRVLPDRLLAANDMTYAKCSDCAG